jgi:hypothetical protein
MTELISLLEFAHVKLNTKTGESYINRWRSYENSINAYDAENSYHAPEGLTIGELYSCSAAGFWQTERSECIKSITNFIEGGGSNPTSTMVVFFLAWLNNDIQHPKIEELARYFVINKLFDYSRDMPGGC